VSTKLGAIQTSMIQHFLKGFIPIPCRKHLLALYRVGRRAVALAVPLQHNIRRIRQLCWPIMITLWVGGALSMGLTMAIGLLLGWAGVEHPAARA